MNVCMLRHYAGTKHDTYAPMTSFDFREQAGCRFMLYAMEIIEGKIEATPTERVLQVTKYLTGRFFELLQLYRADAAVTPLSTMRWLVVEFDKRWRKHKNIHTALRGL